MPSQKPVKKKQRNIVGYKKILKIISKRFSPKQIKLIVVLLVILLLYLFRSSFFVALIPKKYVKKVFIFIPVVFELINFCILYLFIIFSGVNNPNINYIFLLFIFYPLYTSLYPGPRTIIFSEI